MAKIVVLEKIEINSQQREKLNSLGDVEFFDHSNVEECRERLQGGRM